MLQVDTALQWRPERLRRLPAIALVSVTRQRCLHDFTAAEIGRSERHKLVTRQQRCVAVAAVAVTAASVVQLLTTSC